MRRLLVVMVLILSNMTGWANNIKINSEAKVTGFIGSAQDTAIVEFNLSWDNSWRDDFNWDAAWIFLKYKKRGATQEWHHAYLAKEGHTASAVSGNEGGNYTFMFGEVGSGNAAKVTGVYLMRDGIAEGKVNTKIQIKWPIRSNSKLSLTENDFGLNRDSIYIAAYAVEMVYVPYGSYTLGDGFSNKNFRNQNKPGYIPEELDMINIYSGYVMTASGAAEGSTPANLAKRINVATYGPTVHSWYAGGSPSWWQIDFLAPKAIKYFGISGSMTYTSSYIPTTDWRFEGSNDGTNWTVLNTMTKSQWYPNAIAYPVQNSIKVQNPGNYRYYRFYFPSSNMITENIAMAEQELYYRGYLTVDKEDALVVYSGNQQYTLPVSYPKGYRGYYAMKYEVSQEQYVEFLNSLTLAQQKNRVTNNNFDKMVKGDYVFGDLKRPNCRNGIAFIMTKGTGTSAVFGNNLNPANKFYSEDDGQTLACNYLSPADMLAYCDWSGLRPMSELEYEKACRRPSPQIPDKGELAWNSNTGINRVRALSDLTGEKTEREAPFDYKVNVNSGAKINGPLRSGAFATNRTSQLEAGATYWGIMEMSGNLWEMCYNAETAGTPFKSDNVDYSHGNGYLTDAGTDIAAAYWPNVVGAVAVRGGSFTSADSLLRTSDRTWATGNYFSTFTQRDSTVGFRGARSILNSSGFSAGQILCQNGLNRDTVCSGSIYTIIGQNAVNAIGKTTYSWYVSEDNGISWSLVEGATGLSLTYEKFVNRTTAAKIVLFKRKDVCAIGEETSSPVTMLIPAVFAAPGLEDAAALAIVGQALTLTMPAGPSGAMYSWIHPDGRITNNVTLTISSFSLDDAGTYYATYSGGKCEGAKKAIEIYPYQEVGKQAFYYKGSEDVATIPSTTTHIRAYLIGASGGGGSWNSGSYYSGAGGYTDVLFPVVGVSQVEIIVGQGGLSAIGGNARTAAAYPNGGIGQSAETGSGGGGGRTQLRNHISGELIAIAGGGGGSNGYAGSSGAGGGLSGQNAASNYSTGGTQTDGGGPRKGGYLQGAHANTNASDDCGGGGDGYYGGGTTTGDGKPAGGGSGYINRNICIMGKTYTGSYGTRPSQIAADILGYSTGKYGVGILSLGNGAMPNPGNPGVVILQYLKRLSK